MDVAKFIRKMSIFTIRHRIPILVLIFAVTAFLGYEAFNVKVYSIFSDLLPMTHPYIKTHMEYVSQLGDPLKIFLMVRVKKGDIYNISTLSKMARITQEVDLIPSVNHTQVISIASSRLRRVLITEEEIRSEKLMPAVPTNEEEINKIRESVRKTEGILGIYVSPDEKSTLLTANFFGDGIDYNVVFDKVMEIIKKERDDNHEIFASGEPILNGWVCKYKTQTYFILILTMGIMILLLYVYFRNLPGVVVPVVSAGLSAIWGLGFIGLLGYNLDPLSLVVPLLISSRAMSHSVQMTERYFELLHGQKKKISAASQTFASIFPPGTLSVLTDVLGILLIAVAPIPLVRKLAYGCAFWAMSIMVNGMYFTPIFLTLFKSPRNLEDLVTTRKGLIEKILDGIVKLGIKKQAYVTFSLIIGLGVFTLIYALKVHIGDVNPGTPILWPKSEYNRAIDVLNKNYTGVEELYIIVEGDYSDTIKRPEVLKGIARFQRIMEQDPTVAATLSISDLVPPFYRALNLGYPKWEILPDTPGLTGQLVYHLTAGSHPGDYDRYISRNYKDANVIVWYKDHMTNTITNALTRAKDFTEKESNAIKGVKYRLASGSIGILAAINESVESSQMLNFVLIMSITFILCMLTYWSFTAAVILMIPLNITNFITLSIMYKMNIGLNINTLPIVSLGVGIGIDYGIYLLSRICEEYQVNKDYSIANYWAIKTSGRAIFFTATTMAISTVPWYFISNLKFQGEMGLLLTLIMSINMLMALLMIPSMIFIFKPKFVGKLRILLSEKDIQALG